MKAFIPSAGCICTIGVSNGPSCETSKLLNYYVKLDPRVRPLAIAFRQWARVSSQINMFLYCSNYYTVIVKFEIKFNFII